MREAVVLVDERATRRFRRMRCEHPLDPQPAGRRVQPLGLNARGHQTRENLFARPTLRRRLGIPPMDPASPDPVVLLGDIGRLRKWAKARATGSAASTGTCSRTSSRSGLLGSASISRS
ncbi:MAG: hypothetical protein HYY76_13920 [Acidobacteria bacterium]|nr:hypothetical protein [Acidobacteriota bacterium]